MPRPRSKSNMIVANVDGTLLFWLDGQFTGDDEVLLANVRRAAFTHLTMNLTANGPELMADDSDATGAVAALMAARPGRVKIMEAPDSVWNLYLEREDEVVLVKDGAIQQPEPNIYLSETERNRFFSPVSDPRVKLVIK